MIEMAGVAVVPHVVKHTPHSVQDLWTSDALISSANGNSIHSGVRGLALLLVAGKVSTMAETEQVK